MSLVRQLWPFLLTLGVLAIAYGAGWTDLLSLDSLAAHRTQLVDAAAARPRLAFTVFVAVYAAVTAASIPGAAVMTLAGGLLFGPWLGGAASLAGATVGATAIYLAARSAIGGALRRRAERQGGALKRIVDGFGRDAFAYILTLRLIPLVPFWLLNIAAGVAGAPLRAYVVGSLVGMAPATFIYSWVGAGLGRVLARGGEPDLSLLLEPYVIAPLVALGLLALAPIAMRRLRPRTGDPS